MSSNPTASATIAVDPLVDTAGAVGPSGIADSTGKSKAASERTSDTHSSRSSATIKAQKAAAEALALRRRLEREQQVAARERERERQLAELQQELEKTELRAELAAIDANAGSRAGSLSSRVSTSKVSIDRTTNWVENLSHNMNNRDIFAARCEQQSHVTSPGYQAFPHFSLSATRAAAPPIHMPSQQQITHFPAAEAADFAQKQQPYISKKTEKEPITVAGPITETAPVRRCRR
ncbi:hypothetical protein ACJJTC_005260 [Scirpophaga incertulas]